MPPAASALDDLTEISAQIQAAVVFDADGTVLASTTDDERAGRLAGEGIELLKAAEEARPSDAPELVQLDVALDEGSVFVVRDGDRLIAATTTPEPTVGLVFYDLKSALKNVKAKPARKPAASRKKTTTAASTKKSSTRKAAPRKKKTDAS
jgi:predicted regulator of Ras-like GTPase activity (Roadblock/LC7/MglB family)